MTKILKKMTKSVSRFFNDSSFCLQACPSPSARVRGSCVNCKRFLVSFQQILAESCAISSSNLGSNCSTSSKILWAFRLILVRWCCVKWFGFWWFLGVLTPRFERFGGMSRALVWADLSSNLRRKCLNLCCKFGVNSASLGEISLGFGQNLSGFFCGRILNFYLTVGLKFSSYGRKIFILRRFCHLTVTF